VLIECLVALMLVASGSLLLLTVTEATVTLADRATQLDLVEQGAWRSAAVALRAPCASAPPPWEWQPTTRHVARTQVIDGPIRRATVLDIWRSVGVSAHGVHRQQMSVGVRCE
jgi:hypothetical protein